MLRLQVHSLEMVPSLAAAARHIVAQNGYSHLVTIHGVMSTGMDVSLIGGRADVLVCEIVDDLLLGESIQTTIADARARLLHPGAVILPRGATLWVPLAPLPSYHPTILPLRPPSYTPRG